MNDYSTIILRKSSCVLLLVVFVMQFSTAHPYFSRGYHLGGSCNERSGAIAVVNGEIQTIGSTSCYPEFIFQGGFLRVDYETGEYLDSWQSYSTIYHNIAFGVSRFTTGKEAPNGDLVFAGTVTDSINGIDVWIVKTDSEGCLTPDCGLIQVATATEDARAPRPVDRLRIAPNPARDFVTLSGDEAASTATGTLAVYATDGRLCGRHENIRLPHQLPLSNYPAGLYTAVWTDARARQAWRGRFVVQR